MRFDPTAIIIEKMMNYVGENSVRSFLKKSELSDYELHQIYSIAHSLNLNHAIVDILKETSLASIFEFLEGKQKEWIERGMLEFLELPSFSTKGHSFKEVIQNLTGGEFNRGVLKKFGELTEKYGIRCLNNFRTLKSIYRTKQFNLCDFFKIDHSISLGNFYEFDLIVMRSVLCNYNVLRCTKLLLTGNDKINREIRNFISSFDQFEQAHLFKNLPRKPKSLIEIKTRMEKEYQRMVPPQTKLNQSIFPLNSIYLNDYQIFIPNTVEDLINLSKELSNCLDRYGRRIIKNECEILVLSKNGESKIAVEIKVKEGKKFITQFLGRNNSNYFSGVRGKELRENLQLMVNSIE